MNQSSATEAGLRCHECGSESITLEPNFSILARVTSDCKPWGAGGALGCCGGCGLVQTIVRPRWEAEVREIYSDYKIYHQAGGREQTVFATPDAVAHPRSQVLIETFKQHFPLHGSGQLLDVGCGNGAFLRVCSMALPAWKLWGTEVDDKYAAQVAAIRGVQRHHSGVVEDLVEQFDIISLIHVLEHVPGPVAFLRRLRKKLGPEGLLLIEVPDALLNPFTMTVVDHCSHFSVKALAEVVAAAGFEVLTATNTWVPREITVVARKHPAKQEAQTLRVPEAEAAAILSGVRWLTAVAVAAAASKRAAQFGIFGTSIGGTWLAAQTGEAARFFVDEDLDRIGQQFLNRPVLAPGQVPEGAEIFVALPPPLAGRIAQRLNCAGIFVHQPPPLPT